MPSTDTLGVASCLHQLISLTTSRDRFIYPSAMYCISLQYCLPFDLWNDHYVAQGGWGCSDTTRLGGYIKLSIDLLAQSAALFCPYGAWRHFFNSPTLLLYAYNRELYV